MGSVHHLDKWYELMEHKTISIAKTSIQVRSD